MNKDAADATTSEGIGSTGQTQEITTTVKEAEEVLAECGPIESTTKSGNKVGKVFVDVKHLPYILGMEMVEPDIAERLTVGVAMGLSVSGFGGSLLFIEATKIRGSGQLIVTGNLRDVMRESVRTALSLLRSKVYNSIMASGGYPEMVEDDAKNGNVVVSDSGGTSAGVNALSLASDEKYVDPVDVLTEIQRNQKEAHKDLFNTMDIHVHFPAGAIPKDGPSAGVAIVLALTSLFTDKPVRSDTAVTGEIACVATSCRWAESRTRCSRRTALG